RGGREGRRPDPRPEAGGDEAPAKAAGRGGEGPPRPRGAAREVGGRRGVPEGRRGNREAAGQRTGAAGDERVGPGSGEAGGPAGRGDRRGEGGRDRQAAA